MAQPATNSPPAGGLSSATPGAPGVRAPEANPAPLVSTNPALAEIQPGVFQLGDVRIDQRQRTVSFPVQLNLTNGAMEYFLVTSWGKVHESILRTETEPYRIHFGMLLLGAKGQKPDLEGTEYRPAPFVSHPSSRRLPGARVSFELVWTADGKLVRRRAEELVWNRKRKSVLRPGTWVYNGSFMVGRTFVAEREGSIVSLVTDPEALINNVGRGHDDDTIWTANSKNLPPPGTVVEARITLEKKTK